MTDRTPEELLSAVLDGDATAEERAAVDDDADLRRRLADMRAATEALRSGFDTPPASVRDDMIARALAEAGPAAATSAAATVDAASAPVVDLAAARERRRRRMGVVAAVAAAAVVVAGAGAVLQSGSGSDDDTATIAQAEIAEEGEADTAAPPMAAAGDGADEDAAFSTIPAAESEIEMSSGATADARLSPTPDEGSDDEASDDSAAEESADFEAVLVLPDELERCRDQLTEALAPGAELTIVDESMVSWSVEVVDGNITVEGRIDRVSCEVDIDEEPAP